MLSEDLRVVNFGKLFVNTKGEKFVLSYIYLVKVLCCTTNK